MKTAMIKSKPSGDYEEINVHLSEWEQQFLNLELAGMRFKFGFLTKPHETKHILAELLLKQDSLWNSPDPRLN